MTTIAEITKTMQGKIGDVSLGGVSFFIHATDREQAQMLLGNKLFLRFNMPPNMAVFERIGLALGVRHHSGALNLPLLVVAIGDHPVTADQGDGTVAAVGDGDMVGKGKQLAFRARVFLQVLGFDTDFDVLTDHGSTPKHC